MNSESPQKDILPPLGMQQPLPNATATLVLGILSIVFCFTYGVVGLVLGIIALILSNRDKNLYLANPGSYTINSYNNSNAGRVCAIIGLVLSGLALLFLVAIIIFGLTMAGMIPFFAHL